MSVRHSGFITLGGKFQRMAKKNATARLKEIKRLLGDLKFSIAFHVSGGQFFL